MCVSHSCLTMHSWCRAKTPSNLNEFFFNSRIIFVIGFELKLTDLICFFIRKDGYSYSYIKNENKDHFSPVVSSVQIDEVRELLEPDGSLKAHEYYYVKLK